MEHKTNNILHRYIIYVLVIYSLSNLWGIVLKVDISPFRRLIFTLIIGLLVHVICTYPFYWLLAIAVSIIPIFIFNRFMTDFIFYSLVKSQQLLANIINYFKGLEQIHSQHLTIFWILITIVLSLVTWLIIIKIKKVWILIPAYLPFFVYYWYIYIDAAYPTMIFFFILYFILLGGVGYIKAEEKRSQYGIDYRMDSHKQWFKTAVIYGVSIVLLASFFPKRNSIVAWESLEAKVVDRFPVVKEFRDDLVYSRSFGQALLFDFSETGFQQNSTELGGPVRLSDEIVMEVKSPIPLYLRGNVKTVYENNRWEKEDNPYYNYYTNQLLPKEVVAGRVVEVEITNVNMASYTLFTPYQPVRVVTEVPGRIFLDKDFQVLREAGTYKNETYRIQAMIPHLNFQPIEGIKPLDNPNEYLQLPANLSPKLIELTNEITEGKNTSYEKAEAVQEYLRYHYTYSLEPEKTPEGQDFVEYFLFEEGQGYCTYFATAMAVMLRTQGIPTRYIEGYRTPEVHEEDDVYIVRQNNAHAWVEAFIEPIGWVAFEPTPAYQPPAVVSNPLTGNTTADEPIFDEWERIMQLELETNRREGDRAYMEPSEEAARPSNPLQHQSKWSLKKLLNILLKVLYIVLAVLTIVKIIYNNFRIKTYLTKIREIKTTSSIPSLYQNMLDILGEMGYPIETGETPYEYSNRILYNVYDIHHNFKDVTEVFVMVRYGGEEVDNSQVEDFINYLNSIDKKLKNHLGLWRYYWKKYIWGSMYKKYYN